MDFLLSILNFLLFQLVCSRGSRYTQNSKDMLASPTLMPTKAYSLTWYATSASQADYTAVSSSNSGQYLQAVVTNVGIYYSNNYGNTWSASNAIGVQGQTVVSSCSGNLLIFEFQLPYFVTLAGQYVYAATSGTLSQYVQRSIDYGVQYTSSSTQLSNVYAAATNCNGSIVYMAQDVTLWKSINYGLTFIEAYSITITGIWNSISTDYTGQYVVVANSQVDGTILLSTNYGEAFTTTSAPEQNWVNVFCDSTCTNILATADNKEAYVSANRGTSWTAITDFSYTDADYTLGAVSESGQYMILANGEDDPLATNPVYVSNNYGISGSWVESYSGSIGGYFNGVAMDATGQRIISLYSTTVGSSNFNIYMAVNQTSAPSSIPTVSYSPTSHSPSVKPTTFKPTTHIPTVIPSLKPSIVPTCIPTKIPTEIPSTIPTVSPSVIPTANPSRDPTVRPSVVPSLVPTIIPTIVPSAGPSIVPSASPNVNPSQVPSYIPTVQPSNGPTVLPTAVPISDPTVTPSNIPTVSPTLIPTVIPTYFPSIVPTVIPTVMPSAAPSEAPTTVVPTLVPSLSPSVSPSLNPSMAPSSFPNMIPTMIPSIGPSMPPTVLPSSSNPSITPSESPTVIPSLFPSATPSTGPSAAPSATPSLYPSNQPTSLPTIAPSVTPTDLPSLQLSTNPSLSPSEAPTVIPSISPSLGPHMVSNFPSLSPSICPTQSPTEAPSITPTMVPSIAPTIVSTTVVPSIMPSEAPSVIPTISPSLGPHMISNFPSLSPSICPTQSPTEAPSVAPTMSPSIAPTIVSTTVVPSMLPSEAPNDSPSVSLSFTPTIIVTSEPTITSNSPTISPTEAPSNAPSIAPTFAPTVTPSIEPSTPSTIIPTVSPSLSPSASPSEVPTFLPSTFTSSPSVVPSIEPSTEPSLTPSLKPSESPTLPLISRFPTAVPFDNPTSMPTMIIPSCSPTDAPILPTEQPTTSTPSLEPSVFPSLTPSFQPSALPTALYALNWSQSASPNLEWMDIASSDSGQFLVSVAYLGGVYYSDNYGYNWGRSNASTSGTWLCVAMSSSGQIVAVGSQNSGIMMSNNFGRNFTKITSTTGFSWNSLSSSSSGEIMYGGSGNSIFTSTDFGNSWQLLTEQFTAKVSVACDSSGQILVAAVSQDAIYYSNDFGHDWTVSQSSQNKELVSVVMSSTGQYCAAISVNKVYTSNNFGQNWTFSQGSDLINIQDIAIDSSGAKLAAVATEYYSFISTNYGVTWTQSGNAEAWSAITMNGDGEYVASTVYNGAIYIGSNVTHDSVFSPSMQPTIVAKTDSTTKGLVIGVSEQNLASILFALIPGAILFISRFTVLSFRYSYKDSESINQLYTMKYEIFESLMKVINLVLACSAIIRTAADLSPSFVSLVLARVFIFIGWTVFIGAMLIPSKVDENNVNMNQFLYLNDKALNDIFNVRLCGFQFLALHLRNLVLCILFASMFDTTMLRLLPWTRSDFTDRVQGYPNMFIVRCCLYSTFLGAFCQTLGSIIDVVTVQTDMFQAYLFIVVSVFNTIVSFLSVALFAQLAKTNLIKVSIATIDGNSKGGNDEPVDIELQVRATQFNRDVQIVENPIVAAATIEDSPKIVPKKPSPKNYDVEEDAPVTDDRGIMFSTKVKYADETVNILKEQLALKGVNPLEYIPLPAIKAEIEDLFAAANNGIPYDEARLDYLLTCMEVNPEYKKEKEAENKRWNEEIKEFCLECLEITKGFVGPSIFHASVATLTQVDGYSTELAKRLIAKKCLWLVRITVEDIERMHIAELQGRFNPQAQGLDIIETAAIYAALPPVFSKDNKKETWRKSCENLLKTMCKERDNNKLTKMKQRHPAYKNQLPKYDGRETMHEMSTLTSNDAFKPRDSFRSLHTESNASTVTTEEVTKERSDSTSRPGRLNTSSGNFSAVSSDLTKMLQKELSKKK